MKRIAALSAMLLLMACAAVAKPNASFSTAPFPRTLTNARYVYVAAYDGDQFDPNLMPEDRSAIATVQDQLQQWGRYVIVYRPQDADMTLLVQSRPTEDVVAVFDAQVPGQSYLWRAMGRNGLQKGETPLLTQLHDAVDKASK